MDALAARLRHAGLQPRDRVMVLSRDKPLLLLALLACMRADACVLPLAIAEEDPHAAAEYLQPALVLLDAADAGLPRRGWPCPVIELDLPAETGNEKPMAPPALCPEDPAVIILTSGTTGGQRRGALLSHRALSGSAEYMNARMGLGREARELVTAPLEHGFGLGRARCLLHAGGTVVLQSGLLSPRAVVETLEAANCNGLSVAVSGLRLILGQESAALRSLSARIIHMELGTGHLPRADCETLTSLFPDAACFLTYGLTEAIRCSFLDLTNRPDKLHTAGQPVAATALRIVDPEDPAHVLGSGQSGLIQVAGNSLASGYHDLQDSWDQRITDGWFTTGDLGHLDAEGFLVYEGRVDDMINVGGLKVAPIEIETALRPLLPEGEFAIATMPDPAGIEGEVPALFVSRAMAPGVTVERLRQNLEERLPGFKLPRAVLALDRFPKTPATGKIIRGRLYRSWLEQKWRGGENPGLLARLRAAGTRHWPAVAGRLELTRDKLARQLETGSKSNPSASTTGLLIQALARNEATGYPELLQMAERYHGWMELEHDQAVVFGGNAIGPLEASAILLSALWQEGYGVWLPPGNALSLAGLLGAMQRYRGRYLIIDAALCQRIATMEHHLEDSFSYGGFRKLVVTGPPPSQDTLARMHRLAGIAVHRLRFREGGWGVDRIPVASDEGYAGDSWRLVRDCAAYVFNQPPETLTPEATPGDTPGWDSLSFVNLISELENRSGHRLSPRQIMSARCLGDLSESLAAGSS